MPSNIGNQSLQKLFSPARSFMDRLSYFQKFSLISALFLLPVSLLGYGLVSEIYRNLVVTQVEQRGLVLLSRSFDLIREASEFRDRSIVLRVNDSGSVREQLAKQKLKVEQVFENLQQEIVGFDDQEIEHQFKEVRVSWKQLNSHSSGAQGGPHIQFKYYDSFVRSIQVLIDVIGYRGKLVHDPNLNTFLLINMLSDDMPIALRELGRARAYGVYALNQMSVDSDTYLQLDEIYDDLTDSFHLLSNNLGYAVAENEEFHLSLQSGVDRVVSGVLTGRDLMYREIIEADRRNLQWQDYYQQMTDIHSKVYLFIDGLIDIVDQQLENRADQEWSKLIGFMVLTGLLLVIIIFLYAGMYLSVHQTLQTFVEKSQAVANGELNSYMQESTRDEMRELAVNFNQMVTQLAHNQKELVEARKMASLGQLVAGVAHELNTPLGISMTSLSFLEDQMAHANTHFSNGTLSASDFETMMLASSESLGLLSRNLARATGLVTSFKMLSITSKPDKWCSVEVCQYLKDLPQTLSMSKEQRSRCIINCSGSIEAYLDLEHFTILLEILISNAFVHGYGDQTIGDVYISAYEDQSELVIQVEDHGKGIETSMLDQVFDPFVTSSRGGGAAGLGLHIAFNIVNQALMGQIKCESELDKYTRIGLRIPKDVRNVV